MAVMYKNLGIINKVEQRNYYGFPIRSASGSIATMTDGAANVPISSGRFDIDYSASGYSSLRIGKSAKNLCGGEFLLGNAQAHVPSGTTDTEEKTFYYYGGTTAVSNIGGFCGSQAGKYKERTKYTIIMTISKSTGIGANMRVYYTDGTTINLSIPEGATGKTTVIYTTISNKTLNYVGKTSQSGYTTLYYEESGIFEGTLTAQDFEAWSGETHIINFPTGTTIYGGYFESDTGLLVSTKAADGTDLQTPECYMLTPIEMRTAGGTDNFWCDTGDSTIRYRTLAKSIELLFSSGTAGSETFTADMNGTYLILDMFSANGSATITLPRTAELEFSQVSSGSYPRGLRGAIVDLLAGEVVTIANTVDQWTFNFKAVFRLENITATAVIDSTQVNDGTLTTFAPTYEGKILCVGACGGNDANDYYNKSIGTNGIVWGAGIGTNCALLVTYSDNVPSYNMYGYDGGTALAVALQ